MEIRSGKSDFSRMHVRRRDYLTSPGNMQLVGYCSLDYYDRALANLRSLGATGRVYVFSDDVMWCRDTFKSEEFVVVGEEHAGPCASTHLWLMSLCEHYAISNSTFSWWAAWLGKRRSSIVCRPTPWFQKPEYRNVDVCPPDWIKVPRET